MIILGGLFLNTAVDTVVDPKCKIPFFKANNCLLYVENRALRAVAAEEGESDEVTNPGYYALY